MKNEPLDEQPVQPGAIRPATSCDLVVGEIADRYEAIHQRGIQPDLDEHLDQLPGHCQQHQSELLNLLLLTDAHYWPFRMQRDVSKQDLLETYPQHADAIQQTAIARELDDGQQLKWRIGKFQIEGEVSSGQQGRIYQALDRHLARTVALKIAHPHWPQGWLDLEGRALANIHHPNILQVHELAYINDEPVLVMDYIESASLGKKFESTAVSEEQVISIAIQLCEAVQCLHGHDLCHRDIKPENILYSPQGVVTLIDFGLAIKFDRLSNPAEICQTFDGTPAFMAPEQARQDSSIDPRRSDLYAIGATLLWLMTKQPPVVGETIDDVLSHLQRGEFHTDAFDQAREFSPDLADVVIGVLAADANQRPENAESLLTSFREIEQEQIAKSSEKGSIRSGRIQFGWFLVICLVATVGAGAWIVSGQQQGSDDNSTTVQNDESDTANSPQQSFTGPLGIKFVRIPAGQFTMGTDNDAEYVDHDERPAHQVEISNDFYLSEKEITVEQFRQFVEATEHVTEAEKYVEKNKNYTKVLANLLRSPVKPWHSPGFPQTDDHPVVNVSWEDANTFCEWLQSQGGRRYRLPTEAEWEYACSAQTQTIFNMVDELPELSNHANISGTIGRDEFAMTAPVGSFTPNAFGLFDMHGNVAEWCRDWYGAGYYRASPPQNPTGPEEGKYRVYRGGGFSAEPDEARTTDRNGLTPDGLDHFIGFRVVAELKSPNTIVGTWKITQGTARMWSSPVTFRSDGRTSLAFGSWNYIWDGTANLKITLSNGQPPSTVGGNDADYEWTVKFTDPDTVELYQQEKLDMVLKRTE